MWRARAHGSLFRGMLVSALFLAGCNAILGNEERSFLENIGGGASGATATGATAGNEAGSLGGTGTGTTAGGGSAGSDDGGAAGAAGADQGGTDGGGAAASSSTGGAGATTGSSATGGSGGTSDPCECTPGDHKSQLQACGKCGTATVTKVCGDDCRWGEFSDPVECLGQGVCAPTDTTEELLHCERGRWRYKRSTCGSDCQWGPPTETACEGPEGCDGCACIAWCTDPNTGGTTCQWIGCTEAEARAECLTDLEGPSCAYKEPFTFLEWLPD